MKKAGTPEGVSALGAGLATALLAASAFRSLSALADLRSRTVLLPGARQPALLALAALVADAILVTLLIGHDTPPLPLHFLQRAAGAPARSSLVHPAGAGALPA
ncbi:MAG: hypothetical protein K0R03_227 [Moraxellaceae bacterium]|nr:hypothetical protein [Moraxellaceae bacterium]